MRDVIKLCDHVVPVVWAGETAGFMDLWTEMSEKNNCRLIGTDEEGANKSLEVLHHFLVAGSSESSSTMIRSVTSGMWCILQ